MRAAFAQTLTELAGQDPRVLLLTGDLGYMALEPFSDAHPNRFFNAGVAEQNMVGMATGLAEAGFVPFVYSIVNFATLRPYEFIRNGPVLHQLPVRIVGMGGGFEYGSAGPSHHGLEDIGVMRLQPGLTVIAPADHQQARTAIAETWDLPGPVYYRLGKDDKTTVPGLEGRFALGRAQAVREGDDLLIIAMGSVAGEAAAAAELLAEQGIASTVLIVASLNPAPVADLAVAVARFPLTLTVEAHYTTGGLGSLVAEVIAETATGTRLVRCGVAAPSDGRSGSQEYFHRRHGLSRDGLVETARRELRQHA
ncbi:MAG TPA: transketolase C-terminal domain-containing protein [Thermomicrobiales bacterium]